ncbi:unnamed protein product [Cuscuta campestris]|uniref:Uncharacterized protein n=1 Tax=Cuscuta campestris TaxID=132261 RepID=A0A484NPL6_9ASTE|nr:unnamed protein product [Cuscuta campestris]
MSLVDYESSDSDEEETELQEEPSQEQNQKKQVKSVALQTKVAPSQDPPAPQLQKKGEEPSSKKQPLESSHPSQSSELKLPDASFLLNSPSLPSHLEHSSDHSFRVATAMAENARKRDLNGPVSSSYPRSKVPRGSLPHTKNFPDTGSGLLLPPQLSGRSNVVTEDINKLFVRKQDNSSA